MISGLLNYSIALACLPAKLSGSAMLCMGISDEFILVV
jgi:hypothetical protein